MTTAAVKAERSRLAAWCGWWLAIAMGLAPLLAWLGPLGFAPVVGGVGLLTLPALRLEEEDRPAAIALVVALAWAVASMVWSPFKAEPVALNGAKLIVQAALYWAAITAARRASVRSRTWALRLLAWGMAALGAVLVAEAVTGAGLYQAIRAAIGDPIRPDLAAKNVAQGAFVLALLAGPAAAAAIRQQMWWLAVPMVAGVIMAGHAFGADATLIALGLAGVAGLAALRWPTGTPRTLAGIAGLFFLVAPALVWGLRLSGRYEAIQAALPLSWSQRMGYWRHAVDWIVDHPLRGWGLDASRMFAPGIQLHPHDAALQVWLELGLIGAVAAAVFWAVILVRLARPKPGLAGAAACAAAAAYLVFSAVSFGIWQEWWLALGAFAAAACVLLDRQGATARAPRKAAHRRGTIATQPLSE